MPVSERHAPGLAELHLHLYGCIRPRDFLAHLVERRVDWDAYEASFEDAYGRGADVEALLERCRRGDPQAHSDFDRLFVFGEEDAGNFRRFQAKFNLLIHGSAFVDLYRDDAALASVEREIAHFGERIAADQRRQGIAYAEQRFLLSADRPRDSARALLTAVATAQTRASGADMTLRLAPSLPREDPFAHWELVQELALGPHGETFTGVDFCFFEEGHPPRAQAPFFAALRDWNERHPERALALLYHVGESFEDKSLESAVRWVQEAAELGAHRLGHAIALGVDPRCYGPHERSESVQERLDQIEYDLEHAHGLERAGVRVDAAGLDRERKALHARERADRVTHAYDAARLDEVSRRQEYAMARVRSSGAVIEVCPTSNRRIGGIGDPDHHPVHRFLEHGLPVVVGSDDPGIFDTTLAEEIDWVTREAGLSPEERDQLVRASWSARSEVLSGREAAGQTRRSR
ncbi:MAG: hypothetical protein MJE66_11750 [Proteobacteria bacterium]|nr:hypothetical protein [Pseudomonadota bacterium]